MARELILFSLANGAEVIGQVVDRVLENNEVVVDHPLVIRPIQRGPGDYALDLFPHSLANPEGQHRFNGGMILSTSVEIPAPLEKAYLERTSTILLSTQLDNLEKLVK